MKDLDENTETTEEGEDAEDTIEDTTEHYLLNGQSHFHNQTPIMFPFKCCINQTKVLEEKRNGTFSVPPCIPKYDENLTCKHGNHFMDGEEGLSEVSDQVLVYDENGEKIYNSAVFIGKSNYCR